MAIGKTLLEPFYRVDKHKLKDLLIKTYASDIGKKLFKAIKKAYKELHVGDYWDFEDYCMTT